MPDADNVPGDKHIDRQRTERPTVTDPLAREPRPDDPTKTPKPTEAAGKQPQDE